MDQPGRRKRPPKMYITQGANFGWGYQSPDPWYEPYYSSFYGTAGGAGGPTDWRYNDASGTYYHRWSGERLSGDEFNNKFNDPYWIYNNFSLLNGSSYSRYAVFETGISLDHGRTFIGNGNFGIARIGIVMPTNNNLLFTSRESAEYFLNYNETILGENVSLSGIVSATISGVLSAEDAYNNFLYNHKTYRTTRGKLKNIYKSSGKVRSERAMKFAARSKIVKWTGVAGTAWMTSQATFNIVNDISNNQPISGWDLTDGTIGLIGLSGSGLSAAGLISNPVGWGIGAGVATYGWFSFWYELGATYGPINR